jgi:hypothetical protein
VTRAAIYKDRDMECNETNKKILQESRFRRNDVSCATCAHNVILRKEGRPGCVIDCRTFADKAGDLKKLHPKKGHVEAWEHGGNCVCDWWEVQSG